MGLGQGEGGDTPRFRTSTSQPNVGGMFPAAPRHLGISGGEVVLIKAAQELPQPLSWLFLGRGAARPSAPQPTEAPHTAPGGRIFPLGQFQPSLPFPSSLQGTLSAPSSSPTTAPAKDAL